MTVDPPRLADRRWGIGVLVALVLHAIVVGAFFVRFGSRPTSIDSTAIAIDMAPVAVAPPAPSHDVPTPDQTEAPQPKPDKVPPVKPLPFDPPPPAPANVTPDAVVPKQAKEEPAPAQKQMPPAPQTTKLASLEATADKKVAAPVDGAPSSGATSAEDIWFSRVIGRVQQAKHYPVAARLMGQQDNIAVRIGIDRKGKLVSAQILDSHGFAWLDLEAIGAVRRAAPFPAPPAEVKGDPIMAKFVVQFAITKP